MIAVVDYGRGNLRSVQKAFEHLGYTAEVTSDPDEILKADKVVLPGVGAFGDCMDNLKKYGLIDAVVDFVKSGKPFLGICLGLQLLFTYSEEFGPVEGLNLVKGKVVRFPKGLKVPHMGWNQVEMVRENPLLKGIKDGDFFYFVHSYYVVPENEEVVSTFTDYSIKFVSMINKDNIFACQFHPEKSQKVGLKVLDNFAKL
ncbi:glutamine amidotransferase [Thermosulfidibacter takaii ABI70S6]|uniref:Imidazole glycerol phosphate synthase subunit HisH n=1 Tax=Thermosulfidibacter takaii (strain DSM 17441 / JCM 13301 / NBRC 103674 / ABI70S6) TaxID=1298851 RepID=A0A0S3QW00_THET7|nr:imidazole glycerol phosphate synthase subunit HisH [Thermosulfidibacter takaii]BAT72498.1 glutamine amidotransferase [Thermosulfidibacter takaii ABI70S6]